MGKKQQQQQYEIREIIDRKDQKTQKGGTITYYKVLWQGYPDSQATWQKATSLAKSPAVKKDIENFNNKRKTIQKIKQNLPINKISKKDTKTLKNLAGNKDLVTSKSESNKKDDIELENLQNKTIQKFIPSKNSNKKSDQNKKSTQSPKKGQQKKSDVVVTKILQKMRENENQKKQQKRIVSEQKVNQLGDNLKDKIKPIPKGKRNTKEATKCTIESTTENNIQSKLKKSRTSSTLKPIIQQNENQKIDPLPDPILENETAISPITSPQQKDFPLLSVSCVNRIIDHIIEEKSSPPNQVQKSVQDNKSAINENIKLQLTDQLIDHVSLKGRQSIVGTDFQNTSFQKDEFVIKGMMVYKNEYYYLVEENGKSEILSRATMLDKYPYELIVFYEKRINIKPAEINMMIL